MLNKLIPGLFKINKPFIWIFIGIIFRMVLFFYQTGLTETNPFDGLLGHYSCDTPSYLDPVEHLLAKGSYEPDFRMPGYGFIYYLLRLFFSLITTCNILVLIQVVLSGVAIYFVALTAFHISNSKKIFYVVFIISLFTTYSAVYDSYLLTESFCTTTIIFAIYFLVMGLRKKSAVYFILSGSFFAWMIFLKPVYMGLFLIIIFIMVFISFSVKLNNNGFINRKNILILIIPFIFVDTIWITRNYLQHQRLNFLTNPFFYPKEENDYSKALTIFLKSWGGIHSVWMPHGHNLWFESDSVEQKQITFPAYLTRGSITIDSLNDARKYVQAANNCLLSSEERKSNDLLATSAFKRFTQYVRDEQPLTYYFYSPLRYVKMFYADSGIYLLFKKSFYEFSFFQKIMTLLLAALHYFIIIFSTLAAVYFIVQKKKYSFLILLPCVIVLYTFLIFPIILRMPETRFMVPAFPFQIVCLVVFAKNVLKYHNKQVLS